jgi:pimeloyl-ACP methyl ester carboxylesterase
MITSARWECLLALIAALAIAGCDKVTPLRPAHSDARLVRLPDGRRLNLNCSGGGEPTVILESGFGASSDAWSKVQPVVANTTRVCSYDRAGYGLSDPGPMPRDGEAVALDLNELLRAARIDGPFILVGHSAGALYVRLFSDLRPEDVVGMVLVDPSVEHQDVRLALALGRPGAGSLAPLEERAARCLDASETGQLPSLNPSLAHCAPLSAREPNSSVAWSLKSSNFRTQISELNTLFAETSREIDHGRQSYGDTPLIVLTAGGRSTSAPPSSALSAWRRMHQELAARSRRGEERMVPGSSHLMMLDRPDVISSAIEQLVAESRNERDPGERRQGAPERRPLSDRQQ